ncbi:DUF2169 domain-containing protein [Pseudomonas sp. RIT-PI-AD]|uniref:DUF2169 family type VI secretion system accessory protein n=1 Tax=Pseudomonas sp. RIT-PI-AD TaxID=3035294 RepID=UPI0021DAEF53|nr:DUF2169 domain-containing protein [Pseudomonas sp. RIT-PI-AD]
MDVFVGSKHLNASITTCLDATGREHLVVVAKATWRIPEPGQRARPLPPQPLSFDDRYKGEPGLSAMRYGSDFARFKPRCDVLFDAHAHAPHGEPVRQLDVGFRVGALSKTIRVHGPRTWKRGPGTWAIDEAAPFLECPLDYAQAFGGARDYREADGEALSETYLDNPCGIGWAGDATLGQVADTAAPRLEACEEPIRRPDGAYRPMALGPLGRHWAQRVRHAGTYDAHWQREVFPFLPEDFDERFHQTVPEDQQMAYPQGGEEVVLLNLRAGRPRTAFHLPLFRPLTTVRILRKDYRVITQEAPVDTLFFETEQDRFSAVWRTSTPILRRLQEFDCVAIGPVDPAWWQGKALGIEGCATCGSAPDKVA